jgi:diguanylate cyclase (GGDEF)-like protein
MWGKKVTTPGTSDSHREHAVARLRLFLYLAVMIAALGAAFTAAYRALDGISNKRLDEMASQQLHNEVLHARGDIADAQSAERGYIVGGESSQLATYRMLRARIDTRLAHAQELAAGRPPEHRLLDGVVKLVRERLEAADAAVAARATSDQESVQRLIREGRDEILTLKVRIALNNLQDAQDQRQSEVERSIASLTQQARLAWLAVAMVVALGSGLAFVSLYRQASSRRKAEVDLRRTIGEQDRVLYEVSAMSTMMELLHICRSQPEANHVIGEVLPQLLPNVTGGLYVMRPSKGALELQFNWGEGTVAKIFAPDDCWALRRSRTHLVERTRSAIMCRHIEHAHAGGCLCAPLVGHGEVLGVLHLASCEPSGAISQDALRLAGVLAEQLSLALGNLRLQETLRSRSERDPLTDLYNRRHLELSAERELARATRHGSPLSFIMLDVDHFKLFNDNNGHEAGDAVLREVAQVLKRHTRIEDIACRYGGEEFLMVLSGCPLEDAYQKAEAIREAIAQLRVTASGSVLTRITASLGIACYPQHGLRLEDLIRAADGALYKAKDAGRNLVVATSAPGDVMLFETDVTIEPEEAEVVIEADADTEVVIEPDSPSSVVRSIGSRG